MRLLTSLLICLALAVSAAGQAEKPKEATKPAAQAKEEKKAEAAPAPASDAEKTISGTIDVGYRWVSDVSGNYNAYRSVVNLGEGPKLMGVDLTLRDPSKKYFDHADVLLNSWGGEPNSTGRVWVRKQKVYDFSWDYRDMALFNYLPSYADPTINRGLYLNQRSFDTRRKMQDFQLDLFPGSAVIPYFAYTRDSGGGKGVTDFVTDGNEYPVYNSLHDKTDHYRGGVRLQATKYHLTLEQGGTTFKDDQQMYNYQRNPGNRTTPILGQTVYLDRLVQAYGVRGDSIYSKVLGAASPASWLEMYGQFLYSIPNSTVNYTQNNTGNFFLASAARFFTGQQDALTSQAKQPHTSASFGAEIRPFRRLRIRETWMTDRFHNASSAYLAEQFLLVGGGQATQALTSSDRLVMNYNQQQVDVLFDLTKRITLRGGHRYVWGNSKVRPQYVSAYQGYEPGELRRNVGLAGLNMRFSQRLTANVDYEGAVGDKTYFRTGLQDYQKGRARAQYQLTGSLLLAANFSILDNQNPSPGVQYSFRSRSNSASVFWSPKGGKRITVSGEYDRSTLRSDINYLVPNTLAWERSLYRDNAHTATAMVDFLFPAIQNASPHLTLGGSFFTSSGSRPTSYYQPMMRFWMPFVNHVQGYAEWRWYSMSEAFYMYEGFRAHQIVGGLRFTM